MAVRLHEALGFLSPTGHKELHDIIDELKLNAREAARRVERSDDALIAKVKKQISDCKKQSQ